MSNRSSRPNEARAIIIAAVITSLASLLGVALTTNLFGLLDGGGQSPEPPAMAEVAEEAQPANEPVESPQSTATIAIEDEPASPQVSSSVFSDGFETLNTTAWGNVPSGLVVSDGRLNANYTNSGSSFAGQLIEANLGQLPQSLSSDFKLAQVMQTAY
jgi:hypothetical protein